jgi:AbrB family looped-hinge helix DNA binding protein
MSSAIVTSMDSAGRLVIPKEIREKAQLEPGAPLEITVRDGHVEIEPTPREVRLVRKGRFTVIVPVEEDDGPPLTTKTVNETLDAIRNRKL